MNEKEEKIQRSGCEYFKIMKISEINKKISKLEIQRTIEEDRVEAIYQDIVKKSESQNSLLIPGVIIMGKHRNDIYLLDGQHRVAAFTKFLESHNQDEKLMVNFIEFSNKEEITEQFNIINNCKPASQIPKGIDCSEKDKIASYFYGLYPKIFRSVSKVNRPFISKNKFEYAITLLLEKYSPDEVKEKIEDINIELKRKPSKYFRNYFNDDISKLEKMQTTAIQNDFHIGMFLDLRPLIQAAGKGLMIRCRATIPLALKYKVWKTYYETEEKGICIFCEENTITFKGCHYAHDIAIANGGDNSIDNLFPCCADCNLKAGTKSVEELLVFLRGKRINT